MYNHLIYSVFNQNYLYYKYGAKYLFPIICLLYPFYKTHLLIDVQHGRSDISYFFQSNDSIQTVKISSLKPIMTYWMIISLIYTGEIMTNNVITYIPLYEELKIGLCLSLQFYSLNGNGNEELSVTIYNDYINPVIQKNKLLMNKTYNKITSVFTRKLDYDSDDSDDSDFLYKKTI